MTTIDRRRFVASLTAATACTGLAPSLAGSEIAAPANNHRFICDDKVTFSDDSTKNNLKEWWCMVQRYDPYALYTAAKRPTVDFWSRQYSEINYADHLPPEIPRTSLFYESCDAVDFNNARALAYLDTVPERYAIDRMPDEALSCSVSWQRQYLSGSFRAKAGNPSPGELRTALIALDSVGPSPTEPDWAEYLKLFTQPHRSYGHIIGHIHAPGRGLRDWKAFLNGTGGKQFFEQSVWSGAVQCDAVIVTSAALTETDPGLCTRATTEMLVGELMRRLGYALLNREVLDQVLGVRQTGAKHKPRLFALSSSTMKDRLGIHKGRPYAEYEADLDYHRRVTDRQHEIVRGAFGGWVKGERPLNIATYIEHPWRHYFAAFERHVASDATKEAVKEQAAAPSWKMLFEAPAPAYQSNSETARRAGALDLITLWPFNFDTEAEPSS
jgi:hypothetical protein